MTRPYHLLIDGELVPGASSFEVINPATEQAIALCPKADEALLERAIAAASKAFPAWAAQTVEARGAIIAALADALEARTGEFAALLTAEQGKPLDQAAYEVMGGVYTLRAFAGMRIEPKVLRDLPGYTVTEHYTPLGVVGAITPWNFPLVLLLNKLGPALLAGNTVVAKPAPTTPLTTLLLGELARDLLPPGVLNIVCDQNELGAALCAHPDIAKISFTGSTPTGKKVMAAAAGTMKRITLELGGNDAAIVLDDVDPRATARKIFHGAMANAGQICIAIKRVYVPAAMYDTFCDELVAQARLAVVDDGDKPGTTIGPVQNRAQFEKVLALLEDAAGQGAIVAGGKALDRNGFFITPAIVRDIDDDCALVREEQFGPALPVLKYDDVQEVIARANSTRHGLGGTVWGKDRDRAAAVAKQIKAGTVWVNQYLALDPTIPFRGARESGLGVELGCEGLLEYMQAHIMNAVDYSDS